jgi:RimJ/RimL family protein N-acetyltransferase
MKNKDLLIKTNRLILKNISIKDQKEFIEIIENEEVSKTYMLPLFKTYEEKLNLFNRFIELTNNLERFVYGIYLKDRLIGFVNDVYIKDDEIELGYVIDPRFKNQGYASEVLDYSINYLFSLGYKSVKAGAFIENKASLRVIQKCNMQKLDGYEEIVYRDEKHLCENYVKFCKK